MATKVRERAGSWWVFADHQGKRKARKIGKGPAGKKLAQQVAAQWQSHITLGDVDIFAPPAPAAPHGSGPPLKDALEAWIGQREKAGDTRGATPATYRSAAATWIIPTLGASPVDSVTREQLGGLITTTKAAGAGRSVVGRVHQVLRGVFRDLAERKVITTNPAADLGYFVGRMPRRPKVEIFSAAECKVLLAAVEGQPLEPFVTTALLTGVRWGEEAALTRDDVDLERGRLHIAKSWSPKARAVQPTKTDKARTVPITAELADVLRAQLERRTAEGWGQHALVFPRSDGGHLRPCQESWRALLKRAALPYRRWHVLRHTFISHLLRAGVRPELVQRWAGHASLVMTLAVYGSFIPDAAGDIEDAAKIGAIGRR